MESCHSLSFLWKKFVWKHCGVIFDSHSISYKAPWFSLCIVSIAEVDTSLLWLSEAAHRGQSAVQNTLQSVDAHALEKKSDGTSMLVAVLRCWSCCGKTPVSSLVLVAMETFVLPMVVGLRNGFFFFQSHSELPVLTCRNEQLQMTVTDQWRWNPPERFSHFSCWRLAPTSTHACVLSCSDCVSLSPSRWRSAFLRWSSPFPVPICWTKMSGQSLTRCVLCCRSWEETNGLR